MNWLPGPTLKWLAAVPVVLAVGCLAAPAVGWLIPVCLGVGGLLALLDWRELRDRRSGLAITRQMPLMVGHSVPFEVALELSAGPSGSHRGPWRGQLRDVLPGAAQPELAVMDFALGEYASQRLVYRLRIARRGRHRFGPLWLRLCGRWGMLQMQYEQPGQIELRVMPPSLVNNELLKRQTSCDASILDKPSLMRRKGEGTEFETLSEFHEGDEPRRIDWRSSVRLRRLLVRRYQIEQHRELMILIDCGRLMGTRDGSGSKLDQAVDAALMLARTGLERGDRTGVGAFDDHVLGYLSPSMGPLVFKAIVETVFGLECAGRESNFVEMFALLQRRLIKRSLVVIVSDIADEATTLRFRAAMASLARRHVVVFAALRTPFFQEVIEEPIGSVRDIAKKAVTLDLMREREKALHSLRRSGVKVLDVNPAALAQPLMRQYAAVRQGNLL